jgi:hypothetical protein
MASRLKRRIPVIVSTRGAAAGSGATAGVGSTAPSTPEWLIPVATYNLGTFAPGASIPLTGLYTANGGTPYFTYVSGQTITGTSVTMTVDPADGDITAPTTETTYTAVIDLSADTAEASWLTRSGGASVVWAHDFSSANEVNNFRWTPAFGNDPSAAGTNASWCRHITTDGIPGTTGKCLEIIHGGGQTDGAQWWRPFSPMQGGTTTGNGRGASSPDPGASGALTRQAWTPTNTNQTERFGSNTNLSLNNPKGVYAHSSVTGPGIDGNEFWLQMRVKIDPTRFVTGTVTAAGGGGTDGVGKILFLTHTAQSNTLQELVTNQSFVHRMYRGGDSQGLASLYHGIANGANAYAQQTNSDFGSCLDYRLGPVGCWQWSGGWDTVMYHLQPGQPGVVDGPSANGRLRVYASHAGTTTRYKIWDQVFATYGGLFEHDSGWSAVLLASYVNAFQGYTVNTPFYFRYAQVIFSKAEIPWPTDDGT